VSKTNSRKGKSSKAKKNTSAKKSTPKRTKTKWGVFINANHVSNPQEVHWDDELDMYCTEEDTFAGPHSYVFNSIVEASCFVFGAEAARDHIADMIGMREAEVATPYHGNEYID